MTNTKAEHGLRRIFAEEIWEYCDIRKITKELQLEIADKISWDDEDRAMIKRKLISLTSSSLRCLLYDDKYQATRLYTPYM